jgi:hypothetical protein
VRGVPLADVFFILFAGVFFVSRIVVYPRYLLWSALYVTGRCPVHVGGPTRLTGHL